MWKFDDKIVYDNKFNEIINFYLFECPVPGKSKRGKSFQDFGWSGSPAFGKLKASMMKSASVEFKDKYYPAKKEELDEYYRKCGIESTEIMKAECAVFLKHDEKAVMQSLFSAIRNAFAHGSFEIEKRKQGDKIYYFMNFDNYTKAKIILYQSTMLEWIKLIKDGPK